MHRAGFAGGGVKGGTIVCATDQYGYKAVENRKSIYELHSTILHLLGLDHEKLTYHFNGRDMRLTDVHGGVIKEIVAWIPTIRRRTARLCALRYTVLARERKGCSIHVLQVNGMVGPPSSWSCETRGLSWRRRCRIRPQSMRQPQR